MKLSILICHIPERKIKLFRLLGILDPQLNREVEVRVNDTGGDIGTKRNALLNDAKGDYSCFVDDDDTVSNNYVAKILEAIKNQPNCVGLHGQLIEKGKPVWTFRHSITVSRWCKDKHKRIYFRTPNHLNPIRSELARQIGFPSSSWGEDREYSDRIRPLLKSEVFVEDIIYNYLK